MKTRKLVEEKLMRLGPKGDWADALRWVLTPPDCPMCEAPNRVELEMKCIEVKLPLLS